jgi:toxin secretion/phage lysis holin
MTDTMADWIRWVGAVLSVAVSSVLGFWDSLGNLLPWLGFMIFLDIVSGFAAAAISGGVDSRIARSGMIRKMYTLLIVIVSEIIEVVYAEIVGPVPFNFSNFAAGFFILVEVVSILENSGRAGVPWPPWVAGVLTVLNGKLGAGDAPVPQAPITTTTTTTTTVLPPPVVTPPPTEEP